MLEYFNIFYLNLERGICYILTNLILVAGAVLLLNDMRKGLGGVLRKGAECLACFCVHTLMDSVYYALLGEFQMDRVCLAVFMLLYCLLVSRYKPRVRVVRSFVYFASTMVMLPLSEPFGRIFGEINPDYYQWAQYLTLLVVMLLTGALVAFLRHFSFDSRSVVHPQFTMMSVAMSGLTIVAQIGAIVWKPPVAYNLLICFILWVLNLLTYYMFYVIGRITRENISLLTMRHKAEMELEKYQSAKMNFEELRLLRHEIKNHDFYMRSLLEEGKLDQLAEYFSRTATAENEHLNDFDCGNYTLNVIINHAMGIARLNGVTIQPEVLVPSELPFPEEEMCSLLTNLLDNAIEAASSSGAEKPTVFLRIRPHQDYLFIKLINSVNDRFTPQRRLSLRTTKDDRELHGYGTRIIKRIVENHNGSIKYSMDEESRSFVTDVMLELPKEDEA
ncbi:MAG: sensor histidine kinase [Aristaeellaceae bacterium]